MVDSLAPAPFTVLGWGVANVAKTAVHPRERGVAFDGNLVSMTEQSQLERQENPSGANIPSPRFTWLLDGRT